MTIATLTSGARYLDGGILSQFAETQHLETMRSDLSRARTGKLEQVRAPQKPNALGQQRDQSHRLSFRLGSRTRVLSQETCPSCRYAVSLTRQTCHLTDRSLGWQWLSVLAVQVQSTTERAFRPLLVVLRLSRSTRLAGLSCNRCTLTSLRLLGRVWRGWLCSTHGGDAAALGAQLALQQRLSRRGTAKSVSN